MPDMHASRSIFHLCQVRATARVLDAVVRRDECLSLMCEPGISTAALLDSAENELSNQRLRCVRVYGPATGGLALRDLIAQIVGQADPDSLTDNDLKAGFMTLTEPGENHDRVVLLVTEAHNLQPSAMHYVQFACQSNPKLRVVLAGQPSLTALLADPAFAQLRHCMTCSLELPGPLQDEALDLPAGTPQPSSNPVLRHPSHPTPLVRLSLLGSLVLLIGVIGWRHMPAPAGPAVQADTPAVSGKFALSRAAPPMPALDVPAAQPEAVPAEQQHADTAGQESEEVFPPELDPAGEAAPTLAEAAPTLADPSPIEQASAPPGDTQSALLSGPSENTDKPAENNTATREEAPVASAPAPVASASAGAMASVQDVGTDAPPVPEPTPASLPDLVTPPQVPPLAPLASSPVPPQPTIRALVVTVPSIDTSPARGARGGMKPAATPAAAPPSRPTDERHCREIVLHVQLGKDLSDADKQFLRDDCRAK